MPYKEFHDLWHGLEVPNDVDLLKIYGQDHAEPFDFAGPSPDDVVLNAQNTAKGLAIRNKS